MRKTSWMLLLSTGMLFAAEVIAEENDAADRDAEHTQLETRTATASETESQFSYLWQSRYPLKVIPYADDWQGPIGGLDFQDSSVHGRVSELRNLSLLTLAEIGRERLFLGINEDGLLGIHLNAFSNKNDRRYLEIVRLPYLNKPDTGSDAEQPNEELKNPPPQQMTDSW